MPVQDVRVRRRDDERHPAQGQERETDRQVLTAPVADESDFLVDAQAGAAEDADTASLRRAR